ncbi:hypothetical protein D3C85_1416210 [compost metagenome]
MDQYPDTDVGSQHLVVLPGPYPQVDAELVEEAEQLDVGVDEPLPARDIERQRAAEQPAKDSIQQGHLGRVDCQQSAAYRQ